jgi:predicted nuclease of predicted toxin-antitoxin system
VIRLLADENVNGHILKGLADREPGLDLVRVKDVGLLGKSDPEILEWAAKEGRVLLTHDRRTIPGFTYARVTSGAPMPGVFLVSHDMPVGQAIEEISLAAGCLSEAECQDVIKYFPMIFGKNLEI